MTEAFGPLLSASKGADVSGDGRGWRTGVVKEFERQNAALIQAQSLAA